MVQRTQGRTHAPAVDLEEHVMTGSPPPHSRTNQEPRASSGGGGGAPQRLTGEASRAPEITWIRPLFYLAYILFSVRSVPVSVFSAPALSELGHIAPPFCSW